MTHSDGKLDPISEARIREILAECSEHAKGLTEFPARMSDGPGAVSTFYTSLSFADVIGLCNRALAALPRAGAGEVAGIAPVPTNTVGVEVAAEAVVSDLYRIFKDWSKRGFGPDDVTWCEVKAKIEELINLRSPDTTSRDSVTRQKIIDLVGRVRSAELANDVEAFNRAIINLDAALDRLSTRSAP